MSKVGSWEVAELVKGRHYVVPQINPVSRLDAETIMERYVEAYPDKVFHVVYMNARGYIVEVINYEPEDEAKP